MFLEVVEGRIYVSLLDSRASPTQAIPFPGCVDNSIHGIIFKKSYCGKDLLLVLNMDHGRIDAIERSVDEGFINLKINIQCLLDFMAVGITDNIETATKVK